MDGLPPADRLEVCFAGRSNVGKSSLINALTGRKGLARASNTPGRTQEINFFTLGEAATWSTCPATALPMRRSPVVEKWQALLKQYLSGRATLRRAFVLIDARHGVKAVDEEIMALLDTCRGDLPGGDDQGRQGQGGRPREDAGPGARAARQASRPPTPRSC